MAMVLKSVAPRRGAHWVRDGLRLYRRRPLAFTALWVVFMLVAMVAALLPLVGPLVAMSMVPLLSLGYMVASQSVLLEGPALPQHFVEPLRPALARRRLLLLCLLHGVAAWAVLLLGDAIADGGFRRFGELVVKGGQGPELDALMAERGMAAGSLFITGGLALLGVPYWHAAALVHWGHQGLGQALFSSCLALWRCRGAFLVYGLTLFSLMLGLLLVVELVAVVLGPQIGSMLGMPTGLFITTLFYVSQIFVFNDSFGQQRPG